MTLVSRSQPLNLVPTGRESGEVSAIHRVVARVGSRI